MKIIYLPLSPGLRTNVAYRRSEQSVGSSTVRRYFVPEIKYISYKDLPTVYSEMVSRSQNMRNITTRVPSVNWPFMSKQLEKVKNFSDAAK